MRRWLFVMMTLLLAGCGSTVGGRVISPESDVSDFAWTAEEMAKPIAVRRRHATAETSVSLIRLAGAEQPHIHKDHDLVVMLLSGSARLHLGQRIIDVRPGDVMEIPRGVVHWAENTGSSASEVYAIFSPPYDGQDHLPVPSVKLTTP
jgi:mannose-6-phosphate isomerase-like protein (cupin superfamily)